MTALHIILALTAWCAINVAFVIAFSRAGHAHERPREHQSRQHSEITGAGGGADFLSIHTRSNTDAGA